MLKNKMKTSMLKGEAKKTAEKQQKAKDSEEKEAGGRFDRNLLRESKVSNGGLMPVPVTIQKNLKEKVPKK